MFFACCAPASAADSSNDIEFVLMTQVARRLPVKVIDEGQNNQNNVKSRLLTARFLSLTFTEAAFERWAW
jgi:hypothetical protein